MPLFIVGMVLFMTLYIDGYRYDMKNRALEQGGLIQLLTQPTGAVVTYDNQLLDSKTNTRIDALAGSHTVTLTRDSYRPWQKTVTVEPGRVLWLNYVLMVPTAISTAAVHEYASVDDCISVYGRDMMVLLKDAAAPTVTTLQLDGDTAKESHIAIPSSLYDTEDTTLRFDLLATDKSGRYLLIKAAGVKTKWLVIDTKDSTASRSLTDIVGQDMSSAFFSAAESQDVYVVTDGSLRRVDFVQRLMSAPLVSGVKDVYQANDGTLSYIAADGEAAGKYVAGYYTKGADTARVIKNGIEANDAVRFRIDRYDDRYYAVLQTGLKLDIMKLDLPSSDSKADVGTKDVETVVMQKHVDFVSFSPTARFVVAQDGANFTTYDLELDAITTTTLQGNAKTTQQLRWADDYHVWSDRDKKLSLYEFDGANVQELGAAAPGLDIVLTKNKHSLYWFQTMNDGNVSLQYLKLN